MAWPLKHTKPPNQATRKPSGSLSEKCYSIAGLCRRTASTTAVTAAMVGSFASRRDDHLAERLVSALEAGHRAGGEWHQEKFAALLVVREHSFPLVDLRFDYDKEAIAQLRFLWENYIPVMAPYAARAIDPDSFIPL